MSDRLKLVLRVLLAIALCAMATAAQRNVVQNTDRQKIVVHGSVSTRRAMRPPVLQSTAAPVTSQKPSRRCWPGGALMRRTFRNDGGSESRCRSLAGVARARADPHGARPTVASHAAIGGVMRHADTSCRRMRIRRVIATLALVMAADGVGYCVFARVIDGMDVVDKIKAVPTTSKDGHDDVPSTDVIIKSIKVEKADKK